MRSKKHRFHSNDRDRRVDDLTNMAKFTWVEFPSAETILTLKRYLVLRSLELCGRETFAIPV